MKIKTTVGATLRLVAQTGVNLTGMTNPVYFGFQPAAVVQRADGAYQVTQAGYQSRVATVTNAAAGTVEYDLSGADTAVAGNFQGQFGWTDLSNVTHLFPATGMIEFEIEAFCAPAAFCRLEEFYEPIRAMVGDFRRPWMFEDLALQGVVRSVLRMGLVRGYGLAPTGVEASPAIRRADDLARLVYHCAKILVGPTVRGQSWGGRAMKLRTNDQREFWLELQSLAYYADNPAQCSSFQSYYAWVNSLAGINVWGLMTQMRVESPVAVATIGTAGITINTT